MIKPEVGTKLYRKVKQDWREYEVVRVGRKYIYVVMVGTAAETQLT